MVLLLENIKQLITCSHTGSVAKKGKEMRNIGLIENAAVLITGDKIKKAGYSKDISSYIKRSKIKIDKIINCKNKIVTPGFIDSHTHFVFAGTRENEYEMKIAGRSYQEIAEEGGGIISTVNSVRNTDEKYLLKTAEKKLNNFVRYGTLTIESKSGYGLDRKNEIKILNVINSLKKNNKYDIDIYPTYLGAHSVPPGITKSEYIELNITELIPEIGKKKLARFIDVFCEKNYFNKEESIRILKCGKKFGLLPKLHTDQFNSIGGIEAAVKCNAISADHLEVINSSDIKLLKGKNIIANLLPGVSYFLNIPYAPARELIENDIPVSLATDFNPGSCMTENIQMIMSLASQKYRMSIEEILISVTINAAFALNIQNRSGSIQTEKLANILIFDIPSYKYLVYHFGVNFLTDIIIKGKPVKVH